MFDQTFSYQNLNFKVLSGKDVVKDPLLKIDPNYRKELIERALQRSRLGFINTPQMISNKVKGKEIYKFSDLSDELVVRKAMMNIRDVARIKINDRNEIISTLICFLKERIDYRVYRLDIKDFYESFSKEKLTNELSEINFFSTTTLKVVRTFLQNFSGSGLPRGLSISAVLSEWFMKKFDEAVRDKEHVFFYSRYVDDIIIITSSKEERWSFKRELENALGTDFKFNSKKTQVIDFLCDQQCDETINYLGYEINIKYGGAWRGDERFITLNIANKKINKFKTRMNEAFIAYCKNPDFELLKDRIRVLTGNYNFWDYKTGLVRKVGIYYNYRFLDPMGCDSLKKLDKFRSAFLSKVTDEIANKHGINLGQTSKRELLKYSFFKGFNKKLFYRFNKERIIEIHKCWLYA